MTPGGGFKPGQVGPKKGGFKHSGANMMEDCVRHGSLTMSVAATVGHGGLNTG